MHSSLALSVGLPVALAIIMLGLGLSLRLADFARVVRSPKPVIIGLVCQVFVVPAFCLALVYVSALPPAMAVGMMLLAASPGGSSAALYTHLARGDVALSITLTGLSTVLAMFSLPIITNASLGLFYGEEASVYLEIDEVLQIFAIAIVPALIGAFINRTNPGFARQLDRPVKLLATLFLGAVVLFALISQWRLVWLWGPTVGAAALILNLAALTIGYQVPRWFGVEPRQAIALAMEIAIHNAALVIALALSEYMLDDPELAIAPAIYGLIAYITGAIFVWGYNRRGTTSR